MFKGIDEKWIFEQFKNHSMTVIAFVFAGLYFYGNYEKDNNCEKMIDSEKSKTEFWKDRYYEVKDIRKEISIKSNFKKINDSII